MNYFWALLGWIWFRKLFFVAILGSALLFFVWSFPFSDMSDLVTTSVARSTNNQVYLQFETIDLHLIPQPALSATKLTVETALPPLEAEWAKLTPGLFSVLLSLPTIIKASNGDPEASRKLMSKISASFKAEGLLGGDVELNLAPGAKADRTRLGLFVDKMSLGELQKWSDLPVKIAGKLNAESDLQVSLEMQEQPEGEFNLRIAKFELPATTIMVPWEGAMMPVNVPTLTMANVNLKGHLTNGNLIIDDATFGASKDPIHGRLKGQLGMRLQMQGNNIVPMFGSYNLTVDLNTSQMVEKDLGIAFITLSNARSPSPGGGAHYLFRATGQQVGMAFMPNITQINSF